MTKPPRPQGNCGSPLTIADLPPPGTKRWVPRRKAEVVAAVRGGAFAPRGVQPLIADRRCTPFLARVERPIWSSRFAHNAYPAISGRTSAAGVVVRMTQ